MVVREPARGQAGGSVPGHGCQVSSPAGGGTGLASVVEGSAALSPAASPPPALCALSARGAAAPLSRLLVLPPDAPPLSSLPDGSELTSDATLAFRPEREVRKALATAGFTVEHVYGGWARQPVGHEDGELLVVARA